VTVYSLAQCLRMSSVCLQNGTCHLCLKVTLQLCMGVLAGISAFLLRFDFTVPATAAVSLCWALTVWLTVKPLSVYLFGSTRGAWRYFSTPDLLRLFAGHMIGSGLAGILLMLLCPAPFPQSVLVIDFVIAFSLGAGVRTFTRLAFEFAAQPRKTDQRRTLIYGAGQAGVMLLQEARRNARLPYVICGFVDDRKHNGILVQGVPVLGNGADLPRLVTEHRISKVLIAIPSATGGEMSKIASYCQQAGVVFKTMPAISEVLGDRGLAKQIREVAVEDVLGRSSARLEDAKIRAKITGQIVLVTGAAGSIGSELCRQVARFNPAMLVAFEMSETALFFLEREMAEQFPGLEFRAEIGNIQSFHRLREVFGQYTPELVLHAAAYKHVPLMEQHIFEAVENNIFGTHNVATAACEFGVKDFVMISSDKAVNPTNIMGATKRVAELVVRSFQNGGPRYVSVRFGNVLGSNGSVVPIFKSQIARGGPVKVTHPDMERYFMTIPEAAQLVLQACTMGKGGEIFVLDMGKPVKILDLATQLIRLSGLEPYQDIQIEFTGVRPGEKLFEELSLADEDTADTHHQKVKIFSGKSMSDEEMSVHLMRLRWACEQRNARALVQQLKSIVPDYTVSSTVTSRTFSDDLITLGRAFEFRPASATETTSVQLAV
jgi:FlaA1/EpsC-like NDP-sugar epimerase